MAEKVRPDLDGLHFRVGSAEDLADRLGEALTEPDLWDRLRASMQKPLGHREAAQQHLDLYRSIVPATARPHEAAPTSARQRNATGKRAVA
jgi:hypothetical protein